MRKLHTKRYQKQVPGHHIQVDVKFLTFKGKSGEKVRRFQFTAIDDATRVRALKIYEKHTQASAVDFIDHIIEKFPFRIREIRKDNGHEFQAKLHWHVEDLGIRHAYIKRGTPQLNGKVERSHRSDQQEFYQLLSYKGDVDLEAKLDEWERFYNWQCRKVFADPKLAPPLDTLIQPMRRIARSRIGLPGEIDLSGSYARLQSRRALRKLS